MPLRRGTALVALVFAAGALGCAAISGFGDLEKVDCPDGTCSDTSFDSASGDTADAKDTSSDVADSTKVDTTVDDTTGDTTGDTVAVDSTAETAVDTGSLDTGTLDTGSLDTGTLDTGTLDTGKADTGVVDTGKLDTGTLDTGTLDTGTADTGVVDTGKLDTGATDTGTDAGGCLGSSGPTMVSVGSYCIDSTEVTNAHYKLFIDAKGSDTSGQPSYCSWNAAYTPSVAGWPVSGQENFPVGAIDWCDAYAYCKWAGKRLCGKIGGGANAYADHASAASSQWYNACSGSGTTTYPYGSSYVSMRCQDGDIKPNKPVAVASKALCVGGFPGIHDMSGNQYEMEDSCNGTSGAGDRCHVRGGAYNYADSSGFLRCDGNDYVLRDDIWTNVGFRCCSP